jgi:hypothetical protein
MNCREIESVLLSERDGVLTAEQHAALAQHVATCPACQQLRAGLAGVTAAFQADVASVEVPDVGREWQTLFPKLGARTAATRGKRPLAQLIWLGAPLAAAAALALAYLGRPPTAKPPAAPAPAPEAAEAEFVEAGDAKASTMVFVDKESGWLVVWAADTDAATKG